MQLGVILFYGHCMSLTPSTDNANSQRDKSARAAPAKKADFSYFDKIYPRWHDNDVYGHINNAIYYFYFDSVVNKYLIEQGALEIETSPVIGLVAETGCHYFAPLQFPNPIHAGMRVQKIGSSSIIYQIGLFTEDSEISSAVGKFVHVYVDRETRRPVPLPDILKTSAENLLFSL